MEKNKKISSKERADAVENINGLTLKETSFVKGFSLAAFLNPFIWCICYGFWDLFLESLIPVYGIYVWLNLAINGRRIAWERKKWQHFDSFLRRERIALQLAALGWLVCLLFGPK